MNLDWSYPVWTALIAAGLLLGLGTRLGSGCTSGHGVFEHLLRAHKPA